MRFPEFTDEWIFTNLNAVIADFINGKTPSRNNPDFWNGDIPWVSSGELNYGLINNTNEYITSTGKRDANLRLLNENTFLIAITGLEAECTRGSCGILNIKATTNQSCMALLPDKSQLSNNFLFFWYLKVGKLYGIKYTQGTKQQSYNIDILKKLPITIPSILKEQEKIASFLSSVNKKIELLKDKKNEYVEFKHYLLQNLFPRNDELTPKLRSFEHTFVKVESFDNLLNLTQFLIEIISFSISKEFNNIDFISNYWLCSQSIYLLDYNNQPYCKEEIINNFREYLIQILYRLPFLFDVNFSKELPEDLRGLNHYCLFMMKGMSLWISSKDELDLFKDDVNNENKVYEKQVLVEAINHFNLLVNKLYEVSKNNESYNEIIKLQKDLINFERLFRTEYVSNYGEINQIFEYCYREFQWDILFKLSNNLLDIKKNHQIKERTDNLQYLTIIIAFLTLLTQYWLIGWIYMF